MGRVHTFSDLRVIEALNRDYLPVVLDCALHERRKANDRRKKFYKKVAAQRPKKNFLAGVEGATQGYYTLDSSGKVYEAYTYLAVEDRVSMVLAMLERSPVAFRKGKVEQLELSSVDVPIHPELPAGTVILWAYSRIRPLPKNAEQHNRMVGRGVAWVPQAEVEQLLAGQVSESLKRRLLLGHLRDNVRGEPRLFKPEHVKQAEMSAQVSRKQGLVYVRFGGPFEISAPAGQRDDSEEGEWLIAAGYAGTLRGSMVYDAARRQVIRFLMHAEGRCWGEHPHTPGPPPGKYPLEIGFIQARSDDQHAAAITPFAAGNDETLVRYLEQGISSR